MFNKINLDLGKASHIGLFGKDLYKEGLGNVEKLFQMKEKRNEDSMTWYFPKEIAVLYQEATTMGIQEQFSQQFAVLQTGSCGTGYLVNLYKFVEVTTESLEVINYE